MNSQKQPSHPSWDFREGWLWLVVQGIALGYLVFLLTLAAIALVPMLFGVSASIVQSGSMQPHISAGDVVLAESYPASAPVPMGRVVTFTAPAGFAHPGTMLHRIVGTRDDGSLITAGDANQTVDSAPLARADIIGQAVLLVRFIGLPSYWLTHGETVQFLLWLTVTVAALAVQTLTMWRRSRGPHSPADGGSAAVPEAGATRATSAAAAATALALVGGLVTLVMVAGPVFSAFTATTSNSGNSWSMPVSIVPNKVVFTTSPSNSSGGISFATQPVVAIQGALGDPTSSTAPVTLGITTPGGATLTCTTNTVTAIAGVAQFAGCAIDRAGTYTLTATSPGLVSTASSAFTISVGPASRLAFTTSPTSTARNTNFAAQPVVAVVDLGGNTVTSSTASVTLALTTPAGATLTCTTNPKAAVAGVASFAGCRINQAGSFTLKATSPGLASATSASFTVFGTATQLVFMISPSNSVSSASFASQPVVAIQDAGGFTTTATTSITLAITTPAGATLTCTSNPKAAVAGFATFAGCAIGKAGSYTLRATGGSLTAATSTTFTITAGTPTRVSFAASPSSAVSSVAFATQPVVTVLDTFGNTAATTAPVTLSITSPAGATLTCTSNPVAALNGTATFAGCAIAKAGTYTLTATSSGLTSAFSSSFTISAGSASKLVFTVSPTNSQVGIAFPTQPSVTVTDAAGNPVNSAVSVTMTITPPTGGAILTCSSNPRTTGETGGNTVFSGCRIDRAGTFTLTATSGGLASGTSTSFVVG